MTYPALRSPPSNPDLALPYLGALNLSVRAMGPGAYTLSSNPPDPRKAFRMGDWM